MGDAATALLGTGICQFVIIEACSSAIKCHNCLRMSLSTEISRLVKASREEMQEIEDLHKVIRLNFKSLEICLQESPEYLSQIQILKRTIDEIDMLGEDNQEL